MSRSVLAVIRGYEVSKVVESQIVRATEDAIEEDAEYRIMMRLMEEIHSFRP